MIETIEEFGQALALELTKALNAPVVAYDDDHSLELKSGDVTGRISTENLYAMYQRGMPLQHVVEIFIQSSKEASPKFEEVKDFLRLSPTVIKDALGKPLGNSQDGLRLGIAVERERYRSFLVGGMLEGLGKTEEELWATAWNNMVKTMPQYDVPKTPGCDLHLFEGPLGSGYAYVHAASLQGDAYLSMPFTDLGFVGVNIDQNIAEHVLASQAMLTLDFYKNAPDHPVCPAVFQFRDGKIIAMMGAIPIV